MYYIFKESRFYNVPINIFNSFSFRMTATLSGLHVCVSPPTAATPSLSPVAGTGLSRYLVGFSFNRNGLS